MNEWHIDFGIIDDVALAITTIVNCNDVKDESAFALIAGNMIFSAYSEDEVMIGREGMIATNDRKFLRNLMNNGCYEYLAESMNESELENFLDQAMKSGLKVVSFNGGDDGFSLASRITLTTLLPKERKLQEIWLTQVEP